MTARWLTREAIYEKFCWATRKRHPQTMFVSFLSVSSSPSISLGKGTNAVPDQAHTFSLLFPFHMQRDKSLVWLGNSVAFFALVSAVS
jgi:hypothetical protein